MYLCACEGCAHVSVCVHMEMYKHMRFGGMRWDVHMCVHGVCAHTGSAHMVVCTCGGCAHEVCEHMGVCKQMCACTWGCHTWGVHMGGVYMVGAHMGMCTHGVCADGVCTPGGV